MVKAYFFFHCHQMFSINQYYFIIIVALLKQFQPHTDIINHIELLTRSERLLVLTASSDCSAALWDIEGRHIGDFGQVSIPRSQSPSGYVAVLDFLGAIS